MKAQFPGICKATDRHYPAGTEIEKGLYGWQIAGAKSADRTVHPGEIRIAEGEGYGGEPYREGQILQHDGQWLVVRAIWSEYYREDGLSFGVGDDSGYIYFAVCRPATSDKYMPVWEKEQREFEEHSRRRDIKDRFARLFNTADGEYVWTTDERPIRLTGRWIKIGKGFNIYGGGEEALIADDGEYVWRARGNGADGDNWSRSNTSHGIGYRFAATPERLAALADLATLAQ